MNQFWALFLSLTASDDFSNNLYKDDTSALSVLYLSELVQKVCSWGAKISPFITFQNPLLCFSLLCVWQFLVRRLWPCDSIINPLVSAMSPELLSHCCDFVLSIYFAFCLTRYLPWRCFSCHRFILISFFPEFRFRFFYSFYYYYERNA